MKGNVKWFVLLAVALTVGMLLGRYTLVFADDDAGGFEDSESYNCKVCSDSAKHDLNQIVLKETDPGEHVTYNYWNPVPGEEGRRLWLCGVQGGFGGRDLTYLIPIFFHPPDGHYRDRLDGWTTPGDGGMWQGVVKLPLVYSHGWTVKAKWYEDTTVNAKPCNGGADLKQNICYYIDVHGVASSEKCDRLEYRNDNYYHCAHEVKGWVADEDPIILRGEQADAMCRDANPHPGWVQTTDEYTLPPCQTITVIQEEDGSVHFGCTMHYYHAEVSVNFCAAVERKPFPRAAVGKPVFFKVVPTQKYESSSPPIDFCTPDIQNYRLTLIARPDGHAQPIWHFNDRKWVRQMYQTAQGWEVQHTYETSSWGLDHMGPSLNGEWLPAYAVEALVPFRIFVRRTWTDFHGGFHDTGEQPLNLKDFGYPTQDLWVPIRDVTTPPPGAPNMHWPQCVVPVPVIEIQGLITGP